MRTYTVRDKIMRMYDQELLGFTLVYVTIRRRAMDSRSECHGTVETGLSCVRGIANSKDSELMQRLVHGRQSVRGHPKKMEHGAKARSFPWTEVKGINPCRGKSGIMSFHGFFILMGQTYLASVAIRVVMNKRCIAEIVLVGDRGPGSRQYCTNSSEVRGLHELQGDGLSRAMLRPGVTQEWVYESELLRERTKNRRWRRLYDVLAEATHGEVIV
ncbi:hypothetical protein B296_00048748 [Ensete ventricosum]|uniref:Uncharacterized protein n=1 Tax=Ensete ventricosum TaxID=4639 RepID=A0A426WZ84_ENSVE|nr:hypothetical protein B296_00048748 [Ensete ventricosum]